ncbi:GNAT family N-acetyltransferase [Chitinophaga agrisoli]|uniref:GNAT family N-acetyltransferase n=1 Tax=Chitinophaga agrisoli TaxID=2607653 RepID=A0A5B2VND1_9BACT|nr:GNAT family N-acetyltransferase [Chitinophaga agrisoli]KAA2239822.1 GNAT family N-acetyltransferase [Chitinophaga agrisoli]
MTHLLDNAVWNALNSGNHNVAQGTGHVKYYRTDIAPFAGLEENTTGNLQTLYEITPDIDDVFSVNGVNRIDIPQPWTLVAAVPVLQMICEQPAPNKAAAEPLVNLTDEHIPQMLALTKLTNPGPFRERTIELGHYQGIFDGDRLVAMAGQRMYAVPYAEISAVCTHPDYAGRGYAAQLMWSQINRIREKGETPFLHVAKTNERAIKLYGSMGFTARQEIFVHFIKK